MSAVELLEASEEAYGGVPSEAWALSEALDAEE